MLNSKLMFYLNDYCLATFQKSFSTHSAITHSQLLANLMGIPETETLEYVDKYKLTSKEPEMLEETVKYCQSIGFKNEDILKTKGLLTVSHLKLRQHYWSMEEGGFHLTKPDTLARGVHYMRRKINYLKSKNLIDKLVDVEKKFLSYIEDPKFIKEYTTNIGDLNSSLDSLTWIEVHSKILTAFLRYKLNATEDDLIKLFRTHRNITYKSFRTIQKNIAIAKDIGFAPERILNNGYILNNYPTYTETVLSEIPTIVGLDMKKAMNMYPKLVLTSPKNIKKIYAILKKYGVPDTTIRRKVNIFQMSPETVEMRLEAVKSLPELHSLIQHPKFLFLIVHLNRTKSRLSFLQQLKLRCASLSVLGKDQTLEFDNYIKQGKDVNVTSDVSSLLRKHFAEESVESLLKELQRHPFYLQVPLKDMDMTFQFLINSKFKKNSISKVIWILLYPMEKVKIAMNEVKYDPEIKYKLLNDVCKLNLILYTIEKECHFTGNGVWRNVEDSPERTLE